MVKCNLDFYRVSSWCGRTKTKSMTMSWPGPRMHRHNHSSFLSVTFCWFSRNGLVWQGGESGDLCLCNQGPGYGMDSGFVVATSWNLAKIREVIRELLDYSPGTRIVPTVGCCISCIMLLWSTWGSENTCSMLFIGPYGKLAPSNSLNHSSVVRNDILESIEPYFNVCAQSMQF